jgi:hypothetical protein
MGTLTPARRAVVATAVGLLASLSLIACSQIAAAPVDLVGCTLESFEGDLVAGDGQTVQFISSIGDVALAWPAGWTVRPTDGAQLEVVDAAGRHRALTGTRVSLAAASDTGSPLYRDGALVVCDEGIPVTDAEDGDAP